MQENRLAAEALPWTALAELAALFMTL